ncbi:hypothetical protein PsYK624_156560 [Phanerochaete sordida]|uniref:Uncharacterized protein n=1 Tax=Phanerochaete sordida TaxID=48140 RepID=A0A9P3LLC1_9APHY|nr:hypothetical protein PsYK624_156560 [Phanerochaete sordida]
MQVASFRRPIVRDSSGLILSTVLIASESRPRSLDNLQIRIIPLVPYSFTIDLRDERSHDCTDGVLAPATPLFLPSVPRPKVLKPSLTTEHMAPLSHRPSTRPFNFAASKEQSLAGGDAVMFCTPTKPGKFELGLKTSLPFPFSFPSPLPCALPPGLSLSKKGAVIRSIANRSRGEGPPLILVDGYMQSGEWMNYD